MAFDSLSEKLQNVFKNLRSKGRLTEDDVKAALKEVKMALLEADVNFKVVKQFVKDVQERAIGQDVMNGLNPGQMVIKIVNEEMVKLMGSETTEIKLQPGKALTVIMMEGLQGAGKTTTAAKLAGKFKLKGKKVLLTACDIYRPGAIEQLQINGEKQGVEVFSMGDKIKPVNIAKAAIEHAAKNEFNIVILDTAGRLHIDDDMMAELQEIKENVTVHQTVLVVDAMTGQDAVNVAKMFDEKVGIDGVILTKLDGDTRGGAALSIRAVTGKPILYVGMGEKLSDLEQFYPDRMASRILGMGDVLTLIEKAQADIDEEQAKRIEQKMRKNEFDFEMYLESMSQMKKMGGLSSILGMMPGLGMGMGKGKMPEIDQEAAEKSMARTEAIIYSMTPEERRNPSLMNPSRKNRIAKGAGVDIAEVNRLVKQFEQMKKMIIFALIMAISVATPIQAMAESVTQSDVEMQPSEQNIEQIIDEITSETHPINSDAIQNVKEYIIQYWGDLGYDEIECQKFEYNDENNENAIRRSSQADVFLAPTAENATIDGTGENIIVTKKSSTDMTKNLIISAHYDSAEDSVGANDNGSGVAAVLELARILKDTEIPYNIKFILFSGEEKYMLGSRWYVGKLTEDERKQIIGVINIDTIAEKSDLGYMAMIEGNKRPDDIEYDDEGLKKLGELNKNSMSDLFTSSDRFYLTMATNSDHYPFALVDIPAVSIVQDWQEGLDVNESSDVKENMDMQRIVEVIEKVTEVLSEIPSNN